MQSMVAATTRILAVCVAWLLSACTTEPPRPEPVEEPAEPVVVTPQSREAKPLQLADAKGRCASIVQKAPPVMQLARAEFVDAGTVYPVAGARAGLDVDALPEHCRVEGTIAAPAADATPAIVFGMRLPSRWNGRFFSQGTSEAPYDVAFAIGRTTGAAGLEDNALSRGFAVLSSDAWRAARASSDRPSQVHAEAASALESAALAAKALIEAYYGKPPDRSYFVGCAEGGREGLIHAQRWPSMFDGIVAVAPMLRPADAALAASWSLRRFVAVAPRARNRQPVLSRAFSIEELFVVAQAILKQCDALDGAEDGFVMDMAGCQFNADELRCSRSRARQCLNQDKVTALREAMAGPRDAAGHALYAAWPWDPGLAAPAWRAWMLGQAGPGSAADARHLNRSASALGVEFASPPDAKLHALNFDFRRDLPRLRAARDADAAFFAAPLEAFGGLGGRLLLVHGAADPVVSAWDTVAYQRQLNAAPGGSDIARTFIVPGMNHCAGGPSTDRFDALTAVVDWVERDLAPQRIEARGSGVLRDESRPLCPWPAVARYLGSGSPHASTSYECR
ncbi:MAG: tannase/feruloyl esterase family alpha/beta hydrolase [Burkholderiaceae bacterium]|nr:tannase/feruloyl esterase family alpha/beta hydrolase [Burkholderiaceae bacterium]